MSETYSDVDDSANPTAAADWQDRMSEWPAVQAYKQHAHEALPASGLLLDVGCGTGVDAAALGTQRCVGAELSATMARITADRGVGVVRADAHHLPFADGSFAGVRADRVLQHVADPHTALGEITRVAASGGRIVIADPDQESLVIHVPGVRPRVLDRLKELRRDIGYRNGTLITRVPQLLEQLGVRDVDVTAFLLVLTDPDDAFGLPTWPELWKAEGPFADDEVAEWNEAMSHPRPSGFRYRLTFLVVAGTRE